MKEKIIRACMVVTIVLFAGMILCTSSDAEEPALSVEAGKKGLVTVILKNDAPVRAIQFELTGVKITQVRTTDRTTGFLTKFNEQNGKVILLSTTGDEISPGKSGVLEVLCDKPADAVLSGVRIAGE